MSQQRRAALAPPTALGRPLAPAQLRLAPEDFVVEEVLGFEPAGAGSHLLLRVRKTEANTHWVARELARLAGCRPADVGYAGLKDRHAIAVQWFTVPRPRDGRALDNAAGAGFQVLEAHAHTRKLPRGALEGNRFVLRAHAIAESGAQLAARLRPRLAEVARTGVPNYFGPQRFGRDGANLDRIGELAALPPAQRGFVLSAARSVLFNAVLAERIRERSWCSLGTGDLANLDGRGSFFRVTPGDAALEPRLARLELHPTGPLWGAGELESSGAVAALETRIAAGLVQARDACVAAGMRQERRALRLAVHELQLQEEATSVLLRFRLGRGSFATAVLRARSTAAPVRCTCC